MARPRLRNGSEEERVRQLLIALVFLSLGCSVNAEDFNSKVVKQLSVMLGVPAPTSVNIELKTEAEMRDIFTGVMLNACMHGDQTRFFLCRMQIPETFVHGYWLPEKDKTKLHIFIYKRSGIDVLIHEYLHWYLSNVGDGLLNTHEVLEPIATRLLISKQFTDWLAKEEK